MTLNPAHKKSRSQVFVMMMVWILICFFGLMGKRLTMPAFDVTPEYRQAREQAMEQQAAMDQRNVVFLFGGILTIGFFGQWHRNKAEASSLTV